jgi:hypothetical protein
MTEISASERLKIFNEVTNNTFVEISLSYARLYEENPKAFISSFKKYKSIRMACEWMIYTYKYIGAFEEAKAIGKDFTDWANKQDVEEKQTLADTMLILYSILKR